jgi:hypothetical protein
MKKVILSLFLLGTVYAVSAQVTVYRMSSSTNNPARTVTVPGYIVTNFERAYPGVTVLTWEPVNTTIVEWQPVTTWWRASYNDNNRMTHVYYNEAGENYRVALPVLQNNVPEEVITRAITTHGPIVYAITGLKSAAGNNVYQVKLVENGVSRTVWLDGTGTSLNEADVYKVKVDDDEIKVKSEQ